MKTCKTCKYWGNVVEKQTKQCYCYHPKIGRHDTFGKDQVSLENRGTATGIQTGPDFGCVHYEPIAQFQGGLCVTKFSLLA